MKLTVGPIIIPPIAGLVAAATMTVEVWDGWRTSLLPALSIIAAGVLVRLARGFPFSNADHFRLDQFRDVSARLSSISRSLRWLAYIALGSMFGLIVAPNIQGAADNYFIASVSSGIGRAVSFLLAFGITYTVVRIVQVIEGDVSLLRLQASILEAVIARKNAEAFDEARAAAPAPAPIAGAGNFGKTVQ